MVLNLYSLKTIKIKKNLKKWTMSSTYSILQKLCWFTLSIDGVHKLNMLIPPLP